MKIKETISLFRNEGYDLVIFSGDNSVKDIILAKITFECPLINVGYKNSEIIIYNVQDNDFAIDLKTKHIKKGKALSSIVNNSIISNILILEIIKSNFEFKNIKNVKINLINNFYD